MAKIDAVLFPTLGHQTSNTRKLFFRHKREKRDLLEDFDTFPDSNNWQRQQVGKQPKSALDSGWQLAKEGIACVEVGSTSVAGQHEATGLRFFLGIMTG